MKRRHIGFAWTTAALGAVAALAAEPATRGGVQWSFERSAAEGTVILPGGARLGAGKFGMALWMPGTVGVRQEVPTVLLRVGGDEPRLAHVAHPHDTRLNLGRHDWTLECWLWLEPDAMEEGVIFEVGTGPPGGNRLVTRGSVLPAEAAFLVTGMVSEAPGDEAALGQTIEFTDPGGPPHRRVRPDSVTLGAVRPLPRGRWFHVAFVHDAGNMTLRLFLEGRATAVASARFEALPRSASAYVALGCDGERGRVLAGAIDELRVYDEMGYRAEFVPGEGPPVKEISAAP